MSGGKGRKVLESPVVFGIIVSLLIVELSMRSAIPIIQLNQLYGIFCTLVTIGALVKMFFTQQEDGWHVPLNYCSNHLVACWSTTVIYGHILLPSSSSPSPSPSSSFSLK